MNSAGQKCRDPDAFPTFQLFILAIVRLAEPIALTSIFPYAWALVKHFHVGGENGDDASFYAGILISAFSLAEALMGMYWGGLSDRVGRKPVLLVGCFGTMLSMLAVGMAPNMWVALAGRAAGGLLNGNIAVIQTMVSELVKKPEHEPRAYSIMPFVWSIGTIVGPAIGGTFADPHTSFPSLFPRDSLFDRLPFLLPNVICALLLLVSIVLGYFMLEETHPDLKPRQCQDAWSPGLQACATEETSLFATSDALKRPAVDEAYGTFGPPSSRRNSNSSSSSGSSDSSGRTLTPTEKPRRTIWTRDILSIVLALSIFTYHSMAYDATLPIFFEDDRVVPDDGLSSAAPAFPGRLLYSPGGLGLPLRAVGLIMAVDGVTALFVQAVIFPMVAAWVGVYRLFIIVTVLHPLAYFLVPPLLLVPRSFLFPAIYAAMAVRNICAILVYPLLLILLKNATPRPAILGAVNGLAASAGAACRMVAPPVAGYLYTVGRRIDCTALAWYSSALVALIGAVQCFSVARPKRRDGERV